MFRTLKSNSPFSAPRDDTARASFGNGPKSIFLSLRFSRAERLVRETDLPLKSVVELAGFGGMETMRRTFIARIGSSPVAYRRCHRAGVAN